MNWNDALGEGPPIVETVVGSGAADPQAWNGSSDGTSTFYPGESVRSFIESLYGETSLIFRTTPDGADPWVADFSIDGIEAALGNVREGCDW